MIVEPSRPPGGSGRRGRAPRVGCRRHAVEHVDGRARAAGTGCSVTTAGRSGSRPSTPVRTSEERRARLAAYEAALELGRRLSFAVAPVHTRDARVAVDLAPGLLLSRDAVPGRAAPAAAAAASTTRERSVVASMLGELHRQPRPRRLPVWRPRSAGSAVARREDLERCLGVEDWPGGPWSVPAGRLVARRAAGRCERRCAGSPSSAPRSPAASTAGWSPTASRTPQPGAHAGRAAAARLGRRRPARRASATCGEVLGDAEGNEPWYAYVEAGGRPDRALAGHRRAVRAAAAPVADRRARGAVLPAAPRDADDDRRASSELEEELDARSVERLDLRRRRPRSASPDH